MYKLIIGNKNYSTWSFRAWWVLKQAGIEFDEVMIPLYVDGYQQRLLAYAPTAQVPVLIESANDNALVIWDSVAICEYAAEHKPDLWPKDAAMRARARSLGAEMHSGFFAIRGALHMNCRAGTRRLALTPEIEREIRRVHSIVSECRGTYGHLGEWLFGHWSIADAMYAPLLFSLDTYGIACAPDVAAYTETLMSDAWVKTWFAAARTEEETIVVCEVGEA